MGRGYWICIIRGSSSSGSWVAVPSGCGCIGCSSVSVGLGGVYWGASIGCAAIYCLRGPSRGGGRRTREFLR